MNKYQYKMIGGHGELEEFGCGYPDFPIRGGETSESGYVEAESIDQAVEKIMPFLNRRTPDFVLEGNPPARFRDYAATLFSDEKMPRIFLYRTNAPFITVVKFILTDDAIIFGEKQFTNDSHAGIASAHGIDPVLVRGGGIADIPNRWIHGKSKQFGSYNPWLVRSLLRDTVATWKIFQPACPPEWRYEIHFRDDGSAYYVG